MKKIFSGIILIFFMFNCFAGEEIIKTISDQRTGDSIEVKCLERKESKCSRFAVDFKQSKSKKNYRYLELGEDTLVNFEKLNELINLKAYDLMVQGNFNNFATYKLICSLGSRGYRDAKGCNANTVIFTTVFVVAALVTTIPTAGTSLLIAGTVSSIAGEDLSVIQAFLLTPSLAVDLVRQVTIKPVKEIVHHFKTKKFKKHITPLLEEIQESVSMDYQTQSLDLQGSGHEDLRHILIKHNLFRSLKDIFELYGKAVEKSKAKTSDLAQYRFGYEQYNMCRQSMSMFKRESCQNLIRSVWSGKDLGKSYAILNSNQKFFLPLIQKNKDFTLSNLQDISLSQLVHKEDQVEFFKKNRETYDSSSIGADLFLAQDLKSDPWLELSRIVRSNYSSYFKRYLKVIKQDVPWDKVLELQEGLNLKALFLSIDYIDQKNILTQKYKLKADLNKMAETILEVYFVQKLYLVK